MSKSRAKGTAFESMLVAFLRRLWPGAERRALSGAKDRGDVAGTPGVCWEAKSAVRLDIPGWLRETEAERVNSGSDLGVLVIKLKGYGEKSVGELPAILPLKDLLRLLHAAGYGERRATMEPEQGDPPPG